MERYRNVRNVAIVIALGVAVYYVPGGGNVAAGFRALLYLLFAVAIAFIGLRLYRENQFRLMALGDRHRGLLYAGLGMATFCYMAFHRMWETGLGGIAWLALAAAAVYMLAEVYRHSRSYG
jgi:hypothetical protein